MTTTPQINDSDTPQSSTAKGEDREIILKNLMEACANGDRLAALPLNHLFREVLESDAGDMQVVVELMNRLWPKWHDEPDTTFTHESPAMSGPKQKTGEGA